MAEFDTTQLVESIRTRGQIPNAGDWTDQKLLDLATEELRSSIVPAVLSIREGYYDEEVDYAFNADRIRIPHWAVGQKLAGAYYVPVNAQPIPLEILSEKQLAGVALTDSRPMGYILRGNMMMLYPSPSPGATGSIRLKYQARPSSLVMPSECLYASVYNDDGNTSDTFGPPPLVDGARVDLVMSTPGFETIVRNGLANESTHSVVVDSDSTGSLTNGNAFGPSGAIIGGVALTITPPGATCFPQCPTEFWYLLAQTVAVKYLENQGFLDELMGARKELERLHQSIMPAVTPRGGETLKRFKNTKLMPGF